MDDNQKESKYLYAVLKLSKEVATTTFKGEEVKVTISGIAGFIPVFSTIEEAEEHSDDGKYQIIKIIANGD